MENRFDHFSYDIAEISKYWHKLATDEMARYDLKGSYAVYFTVLFHEPEGLTAARLGEVCSRDKADVSRAVTLLEQRGLLKRENDGEKTYRSRIKLTEKGTEAARSINERAKMAVEYGGKGLNEKQREDLYEALDLIVENLRKLDRDGLPQKE